MLLVAVFQCHCVMLRTVSTFIMKRGLLSLRGPLVRPSLLGVSVLVSLCLLALNEKLYHFHTLLLFTCSDDFLSLWSSSPASQCHSHCGRLRLRVSFLTSCIARGLQFPRLCILLKTVFLLNEASLERLLFSLRCIVFLLNADPSLLTWLCTSLSPGLPRWSFLALLSTLVLQARLAPIPRLPILAVWSCSRSLSLFLKLVCCRLEICNILPGDCAAVCSKSASLHPATELRSARGRASVCSGPCCESSSGPSVRTFALVESLQFSVRP